MTFPNNSAVLSFLGGFGAPKLPLKNKKSSHSVWRSYILQILDNGRSFSNNNNKFLSFIIYNLKCFNKRLYKCSLREFCRDEYSWFCRDEYSWFCRDEYSWFAGMNILGSRRFWSECVRK